jgi:CheY-like chemotaxis protein
MLERIIGENIALDLDLSPDECIVSIDTGQFEQVIMNLVVNARDAMPAGGKLCIQTVREFLEGEMNLAGQSLRPAWYVALVVEDTGQGMDEDTANHVFEPFYTTKAPGEGTGLGLSTVYGIVTQCNGRIEVRSAPGKGTAFTIHLPLSEGSPQNRDRDDRSSELQSGTETVLLVEDEDDLIRMFVNILERLNYRVIEARNGNDALKIVESGQPFDLLVTDIVMPKMGGTELAEQVLKRAPGTRVLFISGYAEDEVFPKDLPIDDRFLLVKPFTAADLARRIRTVLDS